MSSGLSRAAVILASLAMAAGPRAASQGPSPAARATRVVTPADQVPGPEHFDGTWDYNAALSVDAATGKPEQSPDNTPRRPGARGVGRAGFGSNPGFGARGGEPVPVVGLSPLAELRDTIRDLLEVPELLTIKVGAETITFKDDLDRERTYPTNGRRQKYQLGTAAYDAAMTWDGPQLKKEIESNNGFKMSETYFLSSDAKQLFVVIRIGEPEKGVLRAGINRVYDRVVR